MCSRMPVTRPGSRLHWSGRGAIAETSRCLPRSRGLATSAITAAKALAGLQVEKAKTEGDRKVVEADLGPVRYLAALLGATDEEVMRWFILICALLLDPAAVLLLLAATARCANHPDMGDNK
jgi:hypothetical protein